MTTSKQDAERLKEALTPPPRSIRGRGRERRRKEMAAAQSPDNDVLEKQVKDATAVVEEEEETEPTELESNVMKYLIKEEVSA